MEGYDRHINPLQLKTDLLRAYIYRRKLSLGDRLFDDTANYYSKKFREARNKVAEKLNDPSIRNMKLYDLRHYFATMLYNKSKDILFTKQQMGHRKVETTLLYVQLINFENDEYTVKVATSLMNFCSAMP